MNRLFLARHGETIWHAENRYAGRTDIALTDKGKQQAVRLAQWAAGANIQAVWSSPLSRAIETATPVADALGLPLQIDDRLLELDFGRGEGLTASEMEAAMPEVLTAFREDPVHHHFPGGEDPAAAAERGLTALRSIAAAAPLNGPVLVVAHSTLLRLILCLALDIPLSRYRDVFPVFHNCTVTEVGIKDPVISLLSFNAPLPLS
jgi:probable phosphoglycerate mutase